jgi:hypothetical protein
MWAARYLERGRSHFDRHRIGASIWPRANMAQLRASCWSVSTDGSEVQSYGANLGSFRLALARVTSSVRAEIRAETTLTRKKVEAIAAIAD